MQHPHDLTGSMHPMVAPMPATRQLHLAADMRAPGRRRLVRIEGSTLLAIALFLFGVGLAALVAFDTGAVYPH